jgi:hypothetical protein
LCCEPSWLAADPYLGEISITLARRYWSEI